MMVSGAVLPRKCFARTAMTRRQVLTIKQFTGKER